MAILVILSVDSTSALEEGIIKLVPLVPPIFLVKFTLASDVLITDAIIIIVINKFANGFMILVLMFVYNYNSKMGKLQPLYITIKGETDYILINEEEEKEWNMGGYL